ncbi:30S ribosomal protein S10 [candidate division WWE3 bacterium CG_4_9_14_3_um_filter_41_6]|uniref:Small ribosomal subunit protein uS10 n=1 Tax=candidate division WWE3 bacterium CG_4_10_14_0_2_um_filter_41_14 TaxID=1975072 RepID=A0A2M7TLA7_UNCKA|nr:MAG: 30S ribosomal protein S10 [candidate division WWE3 bacterium CG_4_10_14_0_2_um_filter_41_14]PJA39373.1 MAG: 30S ribosomal protein S10 [candidate division WWE3 bacterium CG_4_9_14_3_um_filter_41_6]
MASRIRVKLQSYDYKVLDQTAEEILDASLQSGAEVIGPVPLPTLIEKFTVIRGPHIDKRSQEAFEQRTHRRIIDVNNPTPKTLDVLSNLDLPAGVSIEVKM